MMSKHNDDWQDLDLLDDIDELQGGDTRTKSKSKMRKRKWREIETIKEQRRLRRDLADFEQYSY